MSGGRDPAGTRDLRGEGLRVAIAASRFNRAVTDRLLEGARAALAVAGVDAGSVTVAWVPGAFELPLVAQRFAASGTVDAVIALGAVIRGDTDHYEHVATQCAAGLSRVALDTGVPVVFGVLTTGTPDQAMERTTEAQGNKGAEAAQVAIEMANLLARLPKPLAGR